MLKKVLKKISYVLADTEGTVSLGGQPIGNMSETLKKIRESGKQIIFLINDSSLSVKQWEEKYRQISLYDDNDVFYTSSATTVDYIKARYPGKTCYVFGTDAVKKEFAEAGITVVEQGADVAVLTQDTSLTYQKIVDFIKEIKRGAVYIATHRNVHKHVDDIKVPDVGALALMIESVCGISPTVYLGKPNSVVGENVMRYLDCNADEILLVGDRLKTDVQFGIDMGFYTMLVLTGKTDERMSKESDIEPDFTLASLNDITAYLED